MPCPFPLDRGGPPGCRAVVLAGEGDELGAPEGDVLAWGSGCVSGHVSVRALAILAAARESWEGPVCRDSFEVWPSIRCVSSPTGVKPLATGFGDGVDGEGFEIELGGVFVIEGAGAGVAPPTDPTAKPATN